MVGPIHTHRRQRREIGLLVRARQPDFIYEIHRGAYRERTKMMATHEVLILNNNYEPLNVCNMRRAVSLLLLGKAEVLQQRDAPLRFITGRSTAPSVLKMRYAVRRPMPQLRLSRHSVLARDAYTCQYCGARGRELTIDHVVPRWVGGDNSWENLVACCRKCNLKKADKTPQQAGMKLARKPRRPHYVPYLSLPLYLKAQGRNEWREFLPQFEEFDVSRVHLA